MLKERTYQMASNRALKNLRNHIVLICIFMIQFQFIIINCTTQLSSSNKVTFYLVHGLNHGAWCWFKLIPLLEAAGHNVTAIDLAASGFNKKQIQDVQSFNDYSAPLLELMDSLPPDEKVILVGHSFGGMSLALAMDMYPNKIYAAVFVCAFLPDTAHRPSYVIEMYLKKINIPEILMDTLIYIAPRPNQTPIGVILFGPNTLKYTVYPLSPPEDLELGKRLVRPGSLFVDDLFIANYFSNEGFGSVKKVYIKSELDRTIPGEFQRWMIENEGLKEVKNIKNADHMAMISNPQELCKLLLEVVEELS